MHMSDGLVNAPTAAAFGLVAVLGLAIAASRARADLDERTAPMAGLVTAFVFAVQMINFPILPGASGHLLGGALVAILVGPWVGSLCIAIVLVVQALLFADGGLTALGTNITNMALVGVFTGYGVAYALRRFAARSRRGLIATAFVAALVSTVVAALAFVLEYAIGGSGGAALGTVFALMVGLHVLVGIGEGIITAATVGAVAATRPDLVYLLRGIRPAIDHGTGGRGGGPVTRSRFLLGFLLVALVDRRRPVLLRQLRPRRARLGHAQRLHRQRDGRGRAARRHLHRAERRSSVPLRPPDGRQPARRLRRRRPRGHHGPGRDPRRAGHGPGRGPAVPGAASAAAGAPGTRGKG